MFITQLLAGTTPGNILKVWGMTLISAEAKSIGSRSRILVVETSLGEKAYKRFEALISYNVLQSDIEGIEDPDPQAGQSRALLDNMSRGFRLHAALSAPRILCLPYAVQVTAQRVVLR